jgi:hypothetical protein
VLLGGGTTPPPTALTNGTFETSGLSGWTVAGVTAAVSGGAHGGTYAKNCTNGAGWKSAGAAGHTRLRCPGTVKSTVAGLPAPLVPACAEWPDHGRAKIS